MIDQPDLIMMTIYQGRIDELQAKISKLKRKQKTAARIIAGAKHKDDYLISKIIDNCSLRAKIFSLECSISGLESENRIADSKFWIFTTIAFILGWALSAGMFIWIWGI